MISSVHLCFQHKIFWIKQDVGCLAEENTGYENSSRSEPKRSDQWFMDTGSQKCFATRSK
ncbi:hypothetical protein Lal_00037343 [Lupinus albus]|nr:hypothetical protein Lal_00037343 [Lupinus albus]